MGGETSEGRQGDRAAGRQRTDPGIRERQEAYWRRNLRYLWILLAIWFVVSYGFGILLAEPLNRFTLPGTGFPLGFWFAQQGSIYVFVVLIFVYVWLMNRLDREFDVDERDEGAALTEGGLGPGDGGAVANAGDADGVDGVGGAGEAAR